MAPRSFLAMPTPSSLLSAYASLSTSIMLFRTLFDQLFPPQLRHYIIDTIRLYWKPKSSKLTLVIEQNDGMYTNQMFIAVEAFLSTKINPDANRLRITKNAKDHNINVKFSQTEDIVDSFEGISLSWKYVIVQQQKQTSRDGGPRQFSYSVGIGGEIDHAVEMGSDSKEKKHIELKFEKKHKETVINSYLPWVITKWKELENQKKVVKLHNLKGNGRGGYDMPGKESVNLDHPSTFDTLAMDPKMKKAIIDDLDLFLKRRDFYKKVGKVWKRGYLLYGPPGTGKSSLVAAMANYLKFDIYDLQLKNVGGDSSLRQLMLGTSNRSILVIEDIDCSIELPDRNDTPAVPRYPGFVSDSKFSLSGLLNFVDGLWSCCGDERIIIFTTNNKERLDPALLRPGRMDVHIHMSYLTMDGFKILAANYLNIHDHHRRFTEIEELIDGTKVTPAEVAEELMKSDDAELVLEGLVKYLKRKKTEEDIAKAGIDGGENVVLETKKAKLIS